MHTVEYADEEITVLEQRIRDILQLEPVTAEKTKQLLKILPRYHLQTLVYLVLFHHRGVDLETVKSMKCPTGTEYQLLEELRKRLVEEHATAERYLASWRTGMLNIRRVSFTP